MAFNNHDQRAPRRGQEQQTAGHQGDFSHGSAASLENSCDRPSTAYNFQDEVRFGRHAPEDIRANGHRLSFNPVHQLPVRHGVGNLHPGPGADGMLSAGLPATSTHLGPPPGLNHPQNISHLNPMASVYSQVYAQTLSPDFTHTSTENMRPISMEDLFGTSDRRQIHPYFQSPTSLPPITRPPNTRPTFGHIPQGPVNPDLTAAMSNLNLGIGEKRNAGNHFSHETAHARSPGPIARPTQQDAIPVGPLIAASRPPHSQETQAGHAQGPHSRALEVGDWRVPRPDANRISIARPRQGNHHEPSDFRPMSSVHTAFGHDADHAEWLREQRMLMGFSPNYEGNHMLERNRSANIREDENCALWLSGLPPRVDTHMLLGGIRNIGRVFATHINPPENGDGHHTAAAKLIFFRRSEAQNFYHRHHDIGFVLDGYHARVTWNRIRVAQQSGLPYLSRCLQIAGPEHFVNEASLVAYFRSKMQFDVDAIYTITKGHGRALIEFRFGSYRCQAESAKMALAREHADSVRCRYAADPCAPANHYHAEGEPVGHSVPRPIVPGDMKFERSQGGHFPGGSWRGHAGDGGDANPV